MAKQLHEWLNEELARRCMPYGEYEDGYADALRDVVSFLERAADEPKVSVEFAEAVGLISRIVCAKHGTQRDAAVNQANDWLLNLCRRATEETAATDNAGDVEWRCCNCGADLNKCGTVITENGTAT